MNIEQPHQLERRARMRGVRRRLRHLAEEMDLPPDQRRPMQEVLDSVMENQVQGVIMQQERELSRAAEEARNALQPEEKAALCALVQALALLPEAIQHCMLCDERNMEPFTTLVCGHPFHPDCLNEGLEAGHRRCMHYDCRPPVRMKVDELQALLGRAPTTFDAWASGVADAFKA